LSIVVELLLSLDKSSRHHHHPKKMHLLAADLLPVSLLLMHVTPSTPVPSIDPQQQQQQFFQGNQTSLIYSNTASSTDAL